MSCGSIYNAYNYPPNKRAELEEKLNNILRGWMREHPEVVLKNLEVYVYNGHLRVQIWAPSKYAFIAASFIIEDFPGCCGAAISTGTSVAYNMRGKGISYLLQQMKEFICEDANIGILFATVENTNTAELKVLNKSGWKKINEFKNPHTGHNLETWTKTQFGKVVKEED